MFRLRGIGSISRAVLDVAVEFSTIPAVHAQLICNFRESGLSDLVRTLTTCV